MQTTTTSTLVPTGTWSVDPTRSRVGFRVRQLGVATVDGEFAEFRGTVEAADDGVRASGSVSVASLDTGQARRDAHLLSPSFLDAERQPEITFRSTAVRRMSRGALDVAGELTIRGVTRAITLTAEVGPTDDDPDGRRRVTLAAGGRLNRRDFGVTPTALLDAVVADRVELVLDITAVEEG